MIFFVTALLSEARPIIDFFRLKMRPGSFAFPLYERDDMCLVVSGIGKLSMASACSFWQGKLDLNDCPWINVGIAGHQFFEIGTPILAHKVIDESLCFSYYPTFTFAPSIRTATVCTVDRPQVEFAKEYVYEMEAIGFMQAALRASSSELVHVYKVISDHREQKIDFKPSTVSKLIEPHLIAIDSFAKELQTLSKEIEKREEPSLEAFIQLWHFTQTEMLQLKRVLNKFSLLNEPIPSIETFSSLAKAKEVLYSLEQIIKPISLSL
jgi:hypothetical protein